MALLPPPTTGLNCRPNHLYVCLGHHLDKPETLT
jgi:hypothetical protein